MKENTGLLRRRELLRLCAATGAALGGAVLSTEAKADSETNEERKSRYQETDHVKAFYRVNSYPAKR